MQKYYLKTADSYFFNTTNKSTICISKRFTGLYRTIYLISHSECIIVNSEETTQGFNMICTNKYKKDYINIFVYNKIALNG